MILWWVYTVEKYLVGKYHLAHHYCFFGVFVNENYVVVVVIGFDGNNLHLLRSEIVFCY